MKRKITTLFIGPFSPPNSGDGVKNDYLREGFETENITNIIWFDTIKREGGKIHHYFKLFRLMIKSQQIILSLNVNGRYVIIPIFWLFSICSKKMGVLYVIGGAFDKQLDNLKSSYRKIFVKMLKRLDGIFVESKALKIGIEKHGLNNVIIIYNPRKDPGIRHILADNNRNKAVFISRVTDDKGVTVLMNAIESINKDGKHISLDVYGPMDEKYNDYFKKHVADSNGIIKYKGVLKPDEVQSILSDYHFLALPTYHYGEGLPGILVEAGMTGIPIIITRHNALPEYFTHNQSALFVEPQDVESLKTEILRLLDDDELYNTLNKGILKTIEPFKLEHVIDQSLEYMERRMWFFTRKYYDPIN